MTVYTPRAAVGRIDARREPDAGEPTMPEAANDWHLALERLVADGDPAAHHVIPCLALMADVLAQNPLAPMWRGLESALVPRGRHR